MKINVFLSIAGEGGKQAGIELKHQLEAIKDESGFRFQCFLYVDDQVTGGRIIDTYLEQIGKCNFFVPVLTPEYCDSSRYHIKRELTGAVNKEEFIFNTSKGKFKFIFPYAPINGESLICKIPILAGFIFTDNVNELAKSLIDNSPFALLNQPQNSFGFEMDWPNRFFDSNDEPDVLLVLGHSGKESPPTRDDIKNLRICSIEEDLAERYRPGEHGLTRPTQSMRIAEFLPQLIQYLSNYYLYLNPESKEIPAIPTDIDWHLIRYRQKLLGDHNLICFGAGDTNWISRAVLAYYDTLLPVVFDGSGASQIIFYKSSAAPSGPSGKDDTSGQLAIAEYSGAMEQVEADDSRFGAILLLLPNPWNTNKRVIIAAGLTGLGSQAAILALCSSTISAVPHGGAPWARVIRGIEGKGEKNWKAVGFDVVS